MYVLWDCEGGWGLQPSLNLGSHLITSSGSWAIGENALLPHAAALSRRNYSPSSSGTQWLFLPAEACLASKCHLWAIEHEHARLCARFGFSHLGMLFSWACLSGRADRKTRCPPPDFSEAASCEFCVLSFEKLASSDLMQVLKSHNIFLKSVFQEIKVRCNEVKRLVHDLQLIEFYS